jgi:hypothetical protein
MRRRIERETKTVEAMIRIYCRDHHGAGDSLCAECAALLAYASDRLERCKFAAEKPPCSQCPVYCYRTAMREKIRAVMCHAGPRMVRKHPVLAVRHLLDERKKPVRSTDKDRT